MRRISLVGVAACLLASAFVFALRGVEIAEAAQVAPGVAVTSGFEEESWFALWRYAHDRPLYGDSTRLPFAGTYFNWLFYSSYGSAAKWAVGARGDSAIPTAGRALSAALAIAGAVALAAMLRPLTGAALAAALAAFGFAGPLVGWWAFTVRPDIGALGCEIVGLALLLGTAAGRRTWLVAGAALAFFAAWSFKQSYIFGIGAGFLWLLSQRNVKAAALLAATFIMLVALVFWLAGPAYRDAQLHVASANEYYLAHGLDVCFGMMAKTAPLWVLPAWLLIRWRTLGRAARELDPSRFVFAWLGLALTVGLGTALSCKVGASTNYFFSTLPFLAYLNALAIKASVSSRPAFAVIGLITVFQILVATGALGTIDLSSQSARLRELWAVWRQSPEPRYSSLTAFNLPWLSPNSHPIVTAFNYPLQRRSGARFERDGLGGMIREREFAALLLPAENGNTFDGALLNGYVAERRLFDFILYRRLEPFQK